MFPNVRLMIAAMLASIVVLICGFAVFAAFRVSHEPIAHLPAAVAPLQLVAENTGASSPAPAGRDVVEQHSEVSIPGAEPQDPITPAGAAEQHDQAELVESEQATAPERSVAPDAERSIAPEPDQKAEAGSEPTERLRTLQIPLSESSAASRSAGGSTDTAADTASAISTPARPIEPAAEPSTGTSELPANTPAPGDAAASASTAATEETPSTIVAAPGQEKDPAAVMDTTAAAPSGETAERNEGDRPIEPPLPRARPDVGDVASAGSTNGHAHAAAARARRLRIAARAIRIMRFAAPSYAQMQYAQSVDQGYGYGQSNFQGAQVTEEQTVVRRVFRPRPTRVAAKKANSAMGGPFVRVPSQ
jgi:hypothetical protein